MNDYLHAKRYGLVLLALFLLLIAPMTLFVSHIELRDPVSDAEGLFYSLLTDSAGSHGFLITLTILLVAALRLKLTEKQRWNQWMQLGVILVIGFAAKTGLKHLTESPRPYTELLKHELIIPNPTYFYVLNANQQDNLIEQVSAQVSPWRTQHWLGETDYSFPSGHTIFAAICLALFGGLFVEHKRYAMAGGVLVWALFVAYSRLWIGMHRPIDLMGSIVFVAAVYAVLPNMTPWSEKLFEWIKVHRPMQ